MMRALQEELNAVKTAVDAEKKVRVFKRYQALYLDLSGKRRGVKLVSYLNYETGESLLRRA